VVISLVRSFLHSRHFYGLSFYSSRFTVSEEIIKLSGGFFFQNTEGGNDIEVRRRHPELVEGRAVGNVIYALNPLYGSTELTMTLLWVPIIANLIIYFTSSKL